MQELLKSEAFKNGIFSSKPKKRLVDYFAVFERDLDGKVTCEAFPSKQSDSNHGEFPGAHVVGMFCFPLMEQCKRVEINSFVLTSTDYSHTYGAVLRFPLVQTKVESLSSTDETSNGPGEQALCILSHYPFFQLFEEILQTLHSIFLNTTKESMGKIPPLERYLTYLIYEVPVPSRGEQLMLQLTSAMPPTFQTRFPVKNIPEVDYGSFQLLFEYLGIENVVRVVEAILMEQRIVLMSEKIRILAPIGEALLALIFPLQWQLIYIPMLPSYMTLSLKSPVNYVVGLHTSNVVNSEEDLELPAAVVVHLDQNKVINPLMCEVPVTTEECIDEIPKFPSKLREDLINALRECVPNDICPSNRTASSPGISSEENIGARKTKMLPSKETIQLSTMRWVSRVQASFLNVFLKLFSSYKRYSRTPSSRCNGNSDSDAHTKQSQNNNVEFDTNGFLRSRMYLWRQFLSAMVQTQAFQEFLQAASRGDPQINEFDRYLELDKANIHMGKSSKDINKLLFVPIVDDTKLILLKCAEVDDTPVIGADMRDSFLKRRDRIFTEGRFPNPKSDMAFPPRENFHVTRLLEGKELSLDGGELIDESPMVQVNASQHKRGRHTREVSRLIVQKSLMRVETVESSNESGFYAEDESIILSPSLYKSVGKESDGEMMANIGKSRQLKVNISTSSDGKSGSSKATVASKNLERYQSGLNAGSSRAKHRRLATTPSQFTPGAFMRNTGSLRKANSPSPSSSIIRNPSTLRRTASSHMMSTTPDQMLPSGNQIVAGSTSKGGDKVLLHFDAVRKALAKSRARAERAEAKAELSTSKLKEVHSKMIELQRLVLNKNKDRSNEKMSGQVHWKLAAALSKIERLEKAIQSREQEISLLREEIRQNTAFQGHLVSKLEKKSIYGTSGNSNNLIASPGNQSEMRRSLLARSASFKLQNSTRNALKASSSKPQITVADSGDTLSTNGIPAGTHPHRNQYKRASYKDAEIRVLKEKVKKLQSTLERMRRIAENRKRRSSALNGLHLKKSSNARHKHTSGPIHEKLLHVKEALSHESENTEQRSKDLSQIQSQLVERMECMVKDIKKFVNGNESSSKRRKSEYLSTSSNAIRERWVSSMLIDLKQLREDMEFQIDALLHMNKVIDSEISNLKKKVKSHPKASPTAHTQRHKVRRPKAGKGVKKGAIFQKSNGLRKGQTIRRVANARSPTALA